MNESTRRSPRKFDEQFKRAALDRLRTSGRTQKAVAEELGISPTNLRDWKVALAQKSPEAPSARPQTPAEMEAEIQRLRRENQSLRNQRDILKKSLGILCEPLVNGSPT
jgi:transposase